MNACSHCEKSFKTIPALKGHITKTHRGQISETVSEPDLQHVEMSEMTTETKAQTVSNTEISFNLSDDSEDEKSQIFAEEAFYIVTPKKSEIATQTEEIIDTVIVPVHRRPVLAINGMLQATTKFTLNELPAICDDIKMFNGRL